MSSNQIKSIDRNSLWKLKNLKSLILSNNLLTKVTIVTIIEMPMEIFYSCN